MAEVGSRTSSGDNVLKVDLDASVTPEDLEAEIAAAATALGNVETVSGAPVVKEEKKRTRRKSPAKKPSTKVAKKTATPKASVVAKPDVSKVKKKPTPKKIKVYATSDVKPRSHKTVKKTAKHQAVVTAADDAPSAVKVRFSAPKKTASQKKSAPVKPKPLQSSKEEARPVLNRHGKDLKPLHKTARASPKVVTTSVRVGDKRESAQKPYAAIHKDDAQRASKSESAKPAAKQAKHTPHVARIFDTKTYHLPLSVDSHHRKSMFPVWGWLLVFAAAIAVMALAGLNFDLI